MEKDQGLAVRHVTHDVLGDWAGLDGWIEEKPNRRVKLDYQTITAVISDRERLIQIQVD